MNPISVINRTIKRRKLRRKGKKGNKKEERYPSTATNVTLECSESSSNSDDVVSQYNNNSNNSKNEEVIGNQSRTSSLDRSFVEDQDARDDNLSKKTRASTTSTSTSTGTSTSTTTTTRFSRISLRTSRIFRKKQRRNTTATKSLSYPVDKNAMCLDSNDITMDTMFFLHECKNHSNRMDRDQVMMMNVPSSPEDFLASQLNLCVLVGLMMVCWSILDSVMTITSNIVQFMTDLVSTIYPVLFLVISLSTLYWGTQSWCSSSPRRRSSINRSKIMTWIGKRSSS